MRFSNKVQKLKDAFIDALTKKDFKEIARLIIAIYTAIGFPQQSNLRFTSLD